MKDNELVAVYGSLKKNFSNHNFLKTSEFIGLGETLPIYDMVTFGAFPGIFPGTNQILVEIYSVNDETLTLLDHLEGHPRFFKRDKTNIFLVPSVTEYTTLPLTCWIYVLDHNHKRKTYTNRDEKGRLVWDKGNY